MQGSGEVLAAMHAFEPALVISRLRAARMHLRIVKTPCSGSMPVCSTRARAVLPLCSCRRLASRCGGTTAPACCSRVVSKAAPCSTPAAAAVRASCAAPTVWMCWSRRRPPQLRRSSARREVRLLREPLQSRLWVQQVRQAAAQQPAARQSARWEAVATC